MLDLIYKLACDLVLAEDPQAEEVLRFSTHPERFCAVCKLVIPSLEASWKPDNCDHIICIACLWQYAPETEATGQPRGGALRFVTQRLGHSSSIVPSTTAQHCLFMSVATCKVAWHDGIACAEFQRLGKYERGKNDLLLRKVARESRWQRCPKCKMYVERAEGCVYIVCRYCFAACSPKLYVQRAHMTTDKVLRYSNLQVPTSFLLPLCLPNVQGHTSLQQVQEDLVNDLKMQNST
ncbi:hypothetical protein C2845_PM04G12970 [Panicum miliaceum]|uniref:RING-type domain-containing protein n=1 Tax=Panicum miliaceum TaxID=4540 RepID=A0A3L6QTJ8_PANMI|nr:hypothetical protein C2845_PM04G12970 [Panicum miliaceum]